MHYQLIVYPPGTDSRERALLRAWLWWPFAGAAWSLSLTLLLSNLLSLSMAIVVGVVTFTTGHLTIRYAVRRLRPGVCVAHGEYLVGSGMHRELERCRHLTAIGSALSGAEHAVARGELSPVEFELLWGKLHAQARALVPAQAGDESRF